MHQYNVAVAGATGAVGAEFIRLLEEREFPLGSLRLLASSRSAGKQITLRNGKLTVEEMTHNSFQGCDIAFFSAGGARSKEFAPSAVKSGAVVIDNSSAFRMDPEIPLVVPGINDSDLHDHKGIIANPNCSTIIMLMALAPLDRLSPVKRVIVSTYQAASGAGAMAMQELIDQTRRSLQGDELEPKVFPHPIAFNLFSHNSKVDEDGYNEEERKMIQESRKILHNPILKISPTCIRVPVLRAHSESLNVEFEHRPSLEAVIQAMKNAPGVALVDDRTGNRFPMPIEASGRDEVLVGRIRHDLSNENAIDLFVCGDQILKGAALNGFQIAEALIRRGLMESWKRHHELSVAFRSH